MSTRHFSQVAIRLSFVVMRHEPFANLDELLDPQTLSRLVGSSITSVRRGSFTAGHSTSGSRFLAIETNDGRGPRLVVKHVSREWDWVMRATADDRGREALAWSTGLFDRMPPEIAHPVVACAREGSGWAMLMHDVRDALFPGNDHIAGEPISEADHASILDALAALHAAFWDAPGAADPALGFCSPWHHYAVLSLETEQRDIARPMQFARWLRQAWESLWPLLDPDVANLVRRLLTDPTPLCAALARYPQTVVHGDPRLANIGMVRSPRPRVLLLDWHFIGPGAPGLDLAWQLRHGFRHPVGPETTIAWYRERLARRLGSRFDESWWRPQLELSLLGLLVRIGCALGWDATHHPSAVVREWTRESLAWWSDRAREGARWLQQDARSPGESGPGFHAPAGSGGGLLWQPTDRPRSIPHRIEEAGWSSGNANLGERGATPWITPEEPVRGAFRVRLTLNVSGLEALRLGVRDSGNRVRGVWLDVARPGALYHELERVGLVYDPVTGSFALDLEGWPSSGEQLQEITLHPATANLRDAPATDGTAIAVRDVEITQTGAVSRIGRFVPDWPADRARPTRRNAGKRDAVLFAWWTPDTREAHKVGEHYLGLLKYHHPDSRIFVGVNHGTPDAWIETLQQPGLDIEVRRARPEITVDSDVTGYITALEAFHQSDEEFNLVWFGHTKGASYAYADYVKERYRVDRQFWSRREQIESIFADPTIGLVASRLIPTPVHPGHGPNLAALRRVYRHTYAPLGVAAFETFYVMRASSLRDFCDAVGDEFFTIDPYDYGATRWFFEMAIPSVPSMQGYEPFIDMDVEGQNDPRDDAIVNGDVKQNHRLVEQELLRWRADPYDFTRKQVPWLYGL